MQVFDIPADRCLLTSAKTGVRQISPPYEAELIIFDSFECC